MDILQWVHCLWQLGFWMAPADHPSLPECIGPRPCDDERGKHPLGSWGRKATNNPKVLRGYFAHQARNIIVACLPSRLLVVDEDVLGGLAAFAASIGESVPETFAIHTSRGPHYYFRPPQGVRLGNATGALKGYGVDVRGGAGRFGGYVIGAGSLHASGVIYTPADMDAPILPAPDWLVTALTPAPSALKAADHRARSRSDQSTTGVAGLVSWLSRVQEGNRNKSLHWCACRAAEQDLGESAFEELVSVAVSIGLDESASRRTVASARRTASRRTA